MSTFAAVVIGASAGGIAAVNHIFKDLPAHFPMPIILALHFRDRSDLNLSSVFQGLHALKAVEAAEKIQPCPGHLYLAPPGYHLLVERDHSFSLSNDDLVNWARPSIDVLFDSAAEAYGAALIGIILTGANHDGAQGLLSIKKHGGLTLVQDPRTAAVPVMPVAAIATCNPALVLGLDDMQSFLANFASKEACHGL